METPTLTLDSLEKVLQNPECAIEATASRADLLPLLFRVRGQPYSLDRWPQFREMYAAEYVPDTIFMCGRQIGKCARISTSLVRTYNGFEVLIKDLKVGDKVLHVDSNFKQCIGTVQGTFETGIKDVYKIKTRLGSELCVSADHGVRGLYGFNSVNTGLTQGTRAAHLSNGGIFTGTANLDKDRIVLTAFMIGDGCCFDPAYTLTAKNEGIVLEVLDLILPDDVYVTTPKHSPVFTVSFHRCHPIYKWFKEDGIHNHYSHEKTLPSWVFDLTREQTTLFIERLWATDGTIYPNHGDVHIEYCSTSLKLVKQLQSLLCKYGIVTGLRIKHPKCQTNKDCRLAYEIRIEGQPSQKLFLSTFVVPGKPNPNIEWKKERNNRQTIPIEIAETLNRLFVKHTHRKVSLRTTLRRKPRYALSTEKLQRYIDVAKELGLHTTPEFQFLQNLQNADVVWDEVVSIKHIGKRQTYDIEVSPHHNYIMDSIIVHNTMNLSRSEVQDLVLVPHMQLLYVAPLQAQTQRYSTLYLNEAISSCHMASWLQSQSLQEVLSDSKIVKSVHHHAFANGSGIQLTYAKTSSDRARGIYADRIDFDEIQDQLVDNIPVISESLTASSWGVRRFTGTAKTTDNTIESLWEESSKCEWVMKCPACNFWNIPNTEGKVLNMIQGDGVHCIKCGKLLNVREGQFVAAYPERHHLFRGFHIPQIVVPAIVEDPHKWSALTRKVLRLPLPIVMQEILGISCSLGARIITQEDIDRNSTLPSIKELQKRLHEYIFTVGGIDWGVAEQDSFTVHTILGVRPDGNLDVLWGRRFVGFDPDTILSEVAQAHHFYHCRVLAADYGVGFTQNVMLEQRFGLPVVQIMYTRQNHLLAYNPTLGHTRWTVDKTTALELLFLAIRYGRVKFPPKEEFDIYTADLLSPYEEAVESGGMDYRHFMRNPNRPDDFCHALCFASMVAMKLMNSEMVDVIPAHALGKERALSGEAPTVDHIDPRDILASIKL